MNLTFFENSRILITGASGSVGSKLVSYLLSEKNFSLEIVAIDNNEASLFELEQRHSSDNRLSIYLADIRDQDALDDLFMGVDYVFHCAALKHVGFCERLPDQAIQTNIVGTKNVIRSSTKNGVKRVIFTSSDKAVNPTNVMGTSKLMGERLISAANASSICTIFGSTRFGNVLGSSGSVVPIFKRQISMNGPVTVTDKKMTRFVMSADEAVKLVVQSIIELRGGEIFVTKMPVIRIDVLADALIELLQPVFNYKKSQISKHYIGAKPGEKLYEELMSEEETARSIELQKFFVVQPFFGNKENFDPFEYDEIINAQVDNPYNSSNETPLSFVATKKLIEQYNLLGVKMSYNHRRIWPGDH
jgi:FlaA1/EpsC-like NDP-sugar epimerase